MRGRLTRLERRLVWILGSPRSGSTWLLNLLKVSDRVEALDEPTIGAHLGMPIAALVDAVPDGLEAGRLRVSDQLHARADYFFSDRFRGSWEPALRELILRRIAAQVRERHGRGSWPTVVLKEPHGSIGADLFVPALRRSRILWLLRDPRDVLDSDLDASRAGSWGAENLPGFAAPEGEAHDHLRRRAVSWLARTEAVERAYGGHDPSLRLQIRYEDLVADTPGNLARVLDWAGLRVGEDAIGAHSERLAFERIPPEDRGSGRFTRFAEPGRWRHSLSAEQIASVEAVIGERAAALGYPA